jgi:hypothetical protein
MRRWGLISILLLPVFVAPIAWLYAFRGVYGINVVLSHGGSIWRTVNRDDPRLSAAARLALSGKVGRTPCFSWSTTDCRPPSWITRSVTVAVPSFTRASRNGAYPF